MTLRACIACPNVYRGELECPECGEPGEPIDIEVGIFDYLNKTPPLWKGGAYGVFSMKRITPHLRLVPDTDED